MLQAQIHLLIPSAADIQCRTAYRTEPLDKSIVTSALIAGPGDHALLCRRQFVPTFCVRSRQRIEQLHEARLVRITNGRLAIRLHPFGMLETQVVVNLLPKLGVRTDLVKHDYPPFERFKDAAGVFRQTLGRKFDQRWRRDHAQTAK